MSRVPGNKMKTSRATSPLSLGTRLLARKILVGDGFARQIEHGCLCLGSNL
jgi:hypothetical protein